MKKILIILFLILMGLINVNANEEYESIDTNLSIEEAQSLLYLNDQGISLFDSTTLKREKRIARYYNVINNHYDYISKFYLDNKVAYCIEPYVVVLLDNNGTGPQYYPIDINDLSYDNIIKAGRIMHFGYGHPLTGDDDSYYLATQLLLWQLICPNEYEQIISSLQWCTTMDQYCDAVGDNVDVSAQMNHIMNLVNNYDTVPSFASTTHQNTKYEIDYFETLTLSDDGSNNAFDHTPVIDWFNDIPEESHDGINIKKDGNSLKIDIDSLYYEGYDSLEGKTLTFKRKDSEYTKWINNILLYASNDSQKLMGIQYENPTTQYQLSFKLKTSNVKIDKLNEYYQSNDHSQGTSFVIAFKTDPFIQYKQDGLNDDNWADIYDYYQKTENDEYGDFYYSDSYIEYYPILNNDDKTIKTFEVQEDGKVHINNFLPQNTDFWIMEYQASNPYILDSLPFSITTPNQNETLETTFVNQLRDTTLNILKLDSDDPYTRINGATFEIYEISDLDLDKTPTQFNNDLDIKQIYPSISYDQLLKYLINPKINDTFNYQNYQYTITAIEDDSYTLQVVYNDKPVISYSQIPEELEENDKFKIDDIEYTISYKSLNMITLVTNDQKIDILSDNVISYQDIPLEAKQATISEFDLNNIHYQILNYTPHKMTLKATYQTKKIIDKTDIDYDQDNINDEIQIDNITYILEAIQDEKLILTRNYEDIITIDVDPIISYDDIPKQIKSTDTFTLLEIIPPVYQAVSNNENITITPDDDLYPYFINHDLNDIITIERSETLTKPYYGPKTIDDLQEEMIIDDVTYNISDIQYDMDVIKSFLVTFIDEDNDKIILTINDSTTDYTKTKQTQINYTITNIKAKEYILNYDMSSYSNHQKIIDKKYRFTTEGIYDQNDLRCYTLPISYEDIINYPNLQISTELTFDHYRPIEQGDDFSINDRTYTLLSKTDDQSVIVAFPIENNAPFSYQKIISEFNDTYQIIENDKTFTKSLANINDEEVTIISDGTNDYHYYRYDLSKTPTDIILDQQAYTMTISKPQDITFNDILYLYHNKLPAIDDRFLFNDQIYQVSNVEENKIELLTNDQTITIINDYDIDPYFQSYDLYFISQGIYDLNNLFNITDDVTYITNNDNIIIDENWMKIPEDNYHFDIKIYQNKKPFPLSYNQILQLLNKDHIDINDSFYYEDICYTVQEISYENDVETTITISCQNQVNTNTLNYYQIMTECPLTMLHIPAFNNDINDTFKVNNITYTIEDIITNSDNTKSYKVSYLENDQKKYYLIKNQMDKEINYDILLATNSFFTTNKLEENQYSIKQVLPVYKATTGINSLKIKDVYNHNMPIGNYQTIISSDPEGLDIIKEVTSDHYGMVDISDLEPGVYYYNVPNMYFKEEFIVYDQSQIEGEIKVNDLKWGKEYMACEVELPRGYEYHISSEPCFMVKMDVDDNTAIKYQEVYNNARKLDLSVYKVDYDDNQILLNNAYFTIKDITNLNKDISHHDDSTFINKINFEDIPTGLNINDTFKVWKDDPNGILFDYQIIDIIDKDIKIKCLNDNMIYTLKPNTINSLYPLTYDDIIKEFKTFENIHINDTFKHLSKQYGNIQEYKIIDIIKDDQYIWENINNSIQSYKLINTSDDNKMIIEVKNNYYDTPMLQEAIDLGIYVSGSIYKQITTQIKQEDFIWDDIDTDNIKLNDNIPLLTTYTIKSPSYDMIKEYHINDNIIIDGFTYYLEDIKDDTYILSYLQHPDTNGYLYLNKDSTTEDITIMKMANWHITNIITNYFGLRYEDIPDISNIKNNDIITINHVNYLVVENDLINKTIKLQDATSIDENGNEIFNGDIHTYYADQDHNEKPMVIMLKNDELNKEVTIFENQTYSYIDIPYPNKPYKIYDHDMNLIKEDTSNIQGEILFTAPQDNTYYLEIDNEIEAYDIAKGMIALKDIKYGTKLEVCEIKSPAGYIIDNACTTIDIADDNHKTVKNIKPNKKIVTIEKITTKRKIRIRKMGENNDYHVY